jgi:hypothetical protein
MSAQIVDACGQIDRVVAERSISYGFARTKYGMRCATVAIAASLWRNVSAGIATKMAVFHGNTQHIAQRQLRTRCVGSRRVTRQNDVTS